MALGPLGWECEFDDPLPTWSMEGHEEGEEEGGEGEQEEDG